MGTRTTSIVLSLYVFLNIHHVQAETGRRSSRHSSRTVAINFKVSTSNLNDMLRTRHLPYVATFADGQLTDALKHLATDSGTDPKVKRKLISVFASWHSQFKTDPSMTLVAGLYRQYRPADRRSRQHPDDTHVEQLISKVGVGADTGGDVGMSVEYERRRKEKEEKQLAKMKAKEAKENARRAEEDAKRKKNRPRRQPFDFDKVGNITMIISSDLFTETFPRKSHKS
jgi:hypothetical protein